MRIRPGWLLGGLFVGLACGFFYNSNWLRSDEPKSASIDWLIQMHDDRLRVLLIAGTIGLVIGFVMDYYSSSRTR